MSVHSTMDVQLRTAGTVMVARPAGVLDVTTYPGLRDTLLKCAAEQPDALIVELDWLDITTPHAISVFSLVSMRATEWPGIPVVLVAEQASQRALVRAQGVDLFVPMHDSVAAATAALDRPLARRRAVLTLPHGPNWGWRARRFAWDTCGQWGIDVVDDAMTIAAELVENVMRHTTSDAFIRMELRSGILTVAVSDTDPHPPFLRERITGGVRPSGMLLVTALAKAWGSVPTMTGGKTVWATLRVPRPRPMTPAGEPSGL